MFRALLPLAALTFVAAPVTAQTKKVVVTGGNTDLTNVIVRVPLGLTDPPLQNIAVLPDGTELPAGNCNRLLAEDAEAVFCLPRLRAGESVPVTLAYKDRRWKDREFVWKVKEKESLDLYFIDQPVLRYMMLPHDTSTKDSHELTFKIFHHVFDPLDGKVLLTSGAGLAADKSLLYPHHRGIFFGFNKISYNGQECDIWHGRNGEYQEHEKDLGKEASALHARQRAQIGWHGRDGKKFATETREIVVYHLLQGDFIDFTSVLTTDLPKVHLDGDPQHAGFHFRASQEVARRTKADTYYVRPDGEGKPGETRNWDPKTKQGPVNLPWDAMSFVVNGKRYTCLYLDHPANPKEARGSERDYGRFGNYFEYDLTPQTPLKVRYRLWLQDGKMTVAQCEDLSRGFTSPPTVK